MAEPQIQELQIQAPQNGLRRTSHFARIEALRNAYAESALTGDNLARCYAQLLRIRRVEEEILRLHPKQETESLAHPPFGLEAVAVAICNHLRKEDAVFGNCRAYTAYLAKGGDVKTLWAELHGKKTGCDGGNGGSINITGARVYVTGNSTMAASSIPKAVGYALALKMREEDRVVACLFDEGVTHAGVIHESIKFAALHRLPILFACGFREYVLGYQVSAHVAAYGFCDRFRAYGIPCEKEDSGDFLKIYEIAGRSIADIRKGLGPRFIEFKAIHGCDHHVGSGQDRQNGYRFDARLATTFAIDPAARSGDMLSDDQQREIAAEVEREIAEAIAFAEESPFPVNEEIFEHVFAARK